MEEKEYLPNGAFRQWLKEKGFKPVGSNTSNSEYFTNSQGHTVVLNYKEDRGIRFINQKGFTLLSEDKVKELDFILFERFNEAEKHYPQNYQ